MKEKKRRECKCTMWLDIMIHDHPHCQSIKWDHSKKKKEGGNSDPDQDQTLIVQFPPHVGKDKHYKRTICRNSVMISEAFLLLYTKDLKKGGPNLGLVKLWRKEEYL